jgi:hypothetical protein
MRLRLALFAFVLLFPVSARAAEITAFLSKATPDDDWASGVGGAFSIGLLSIVHFEGEICRQSAEIEGAQMYSLTGSVLLAPPTGKVVPYGGLGIGGFRQEFGERSDTGSLTALVLGLKFKPVGLLVLKGEYRRLGLSGDPIFPMDNRFSVGAGLAF